MAAEVSVSHRDRPTLLVKAPDEDDGGGGDDDDASTAAENAPADTPTRASENATNYGQTYQPGVVRAALCVKLSLVLLLLGVAGGLGAYFFVTNSTDEYGAFKSDFNQACDRLTSQLPLAAQQKYFAGVTVAGLLRFGQPAGNVLNGIAPDQYGMFQATVTTAATQSASKVVEFAPAVLEASRPGFEALVLAHPELWTNSSTMAGLASLGIWTKNGTVPVAASHTPVSGIHFPVFLYGPIVGSEGVFLYDLTSEPIRAAAVAACLATGAPAVTEIIYLVQDLIPRPSSLMVAPVYQNGTGALLGISIVVFYWDTLLTNAGISGVDVVLRSPAGTAQTFALTQTGVINKGKGDLHDTTAESLVRTVSLNVGSIYTFSLFPQREQYNRYITDAPRTGTIIIVVIVGFCCACFVAYEALANRLMHFLQRRVAHADALLADVFPRNIKERLVMDLERGDDARRSIDQSKWRASHVEATPSAGSEHSGHPGLIERRGSFTSGLIAEHYPSCTILFSDLENFTTWSSSVPPAEVLALLELIFTTFDALATKHRVYKIETIGDAFVACSGCPTASATHASQVASLALDMLEALPALRVQSGMTTLNVRIGLHSGSVMGGVLRARGRRFQLFGDSMNTASRMESNGIPGRVHISSSTFDLLEAAGTHRCEPRGEVQIKGKGAMETYWLVGRTAVARRMSFQGTPPKGGAGMDSVARQRRGSASQGSRRGSGALLPGGSLGRALTAASGPSPPLPPPRLSRLLSGVAAVVLAPILSSSDLAATKHADSKHAAAAGGDGEPGGSGGPAMPAADALHVTPAFDREASM